MFALLVTYESGRSYLLSSAYATLADARRVRDYIMKGESDKTCRIVALDNAWQVTWRATDSRGDCTAMYSSADSALSMAEFAEYERGYVASVVEMDCVA